MREVKQWSVSELQKSLFLGRHKSLKRMFCYLNSPVLCYIKAQLMRKCQCRKQWLWPSSCKHLLRRQSEWSQFWTREQNVLWRFQLKSNKTKKPNGSLKVKTIWNLYFNRVQHKKPEGSQFVQGHYLKNITNYLFLTPKSVWNPTQTKARTHSQHWASFRMGLLWQEPTL